MPNELMKTLTIGANTYDLPQKTSDLTNDSGFITSETDPTVPSWAKASSKPTYTASEVGAATSSHTHGNITNGGDITTNATIASGDRIIINDESASKITNSSITFGSSTTQYLANNGTWQNVPTVPTKTSDLTNDSGFITSESDPVFSASAAHGITSTDITNWNSKSDFSGNYNDLTNKPTIPAAVTESTVAGWGFTKNTGTYSKPSGGIPKTDLASAVQTSLGKADTALQSYTESDPIFTASAAHGITSTNITNWNNKISEPASEGTNGQVLMTNGSGTRTWGSVSTADEKIKLTSQSTSGNYPLIFGPTSITSNSTYQGYYNTGITINPNTKAVTATTFVGALTGTASGNLTSSSTLDASKLSGAIPSAVTATTQTSTDNSTKIATTAFVKTAIDNLPEPMVFKGSLGTGGTITSLPTASTSNTGYTYKVITAGTYASQSAKIGDTFISDGSAWMLIPSGDEPSGTVTSITLKATSPISIDSNSAITTSGTRTLSHANSGVTAGTYKSVTVDSKGHVTAGSNPSETDPVFTGSAAYGISSSDITNWNGKTSNTGTVTSVRVQATSPVTSSVNTAQSSTLNTTIALADGYGDTKNPYASKTKNYVLAAPSSANGVPSFRALVANDIPSLTKSKISDFPTIPTKTSQLTNDSNFYSEPTYGIGTADPITRPLVETVRANRLAFLPASQIIIEQTTDGGTTWTDAGVSDATKLGLFSGTRPSIYLPLLNNARSTNCGLRVTITAMRYNVPSGTAETAKYNYWNSTYVASQERYCSIDKFWFWIGANGDRQRIKVESATGANPNNWHTKFDTDFGANGWSGSDWVKTSYGTFGGGTNQTDNEWNWRITFFSRMADGASAFTQTSKQAIYQIMAYGENVWGASNNLMKIDRLYAYDASQNATFPAKVTATGGFVGSVSDVATQGSATNSTARHIWFSDSSTETKRAHNDNFKYTPSTNTITANLSGSATLTGTPTAPTASASTNNTQIATTAFVKSVMPTKLSSLTDDLGSSPTHTHSQYLTSYTETDPVFTASAAHGITSTDITNWNGKTSNTGTVTSVRVQATSPVQSSTSTAQSTTLNTTISLADGYGDTKNPYASKTKNYVLAAPSSANGVPSFRALVAADIPSLTKSKISDFPSLATVATSGSYNDLTNKPTIVSMTATTVTIATSNWSNKSCTKTVSGVTSSNTIIVSPAASSFTAYSEAQVRATAQGTNQVTFTCTDIPSSSLTVNIVIFQ